jgi:hypothetical protein
MKAGSAFVTVMHLPMKFVAISKAPQLLQARFIGFVGDRMIARNPTPILLLANKVWQWVKQRIIGNTAALAAFYSNKLSHRGACGNQMLPWVGGLRYN